MFCLSALLSTLSSFRSFIAASIKINDLIRFCVVLLLYFFSFVSTLWPDLGFEDKFYGLGFGTSGLGLGLKALALASKMQALTVASKVQALTVASKVQTLTLASKMQALTLASKVQALALASKSKVQALTLASKASLTLALASALRDALTFLHQHQPQTQGPTTNAKVKLKVMVGL